MVTIVNLSNTDKIKKSWATPWHLFISHDYRYRLITGKDRTRLLLFQPICQQLTTVVGGRVADWRNLLLVARGVSRNVFCDCICIWYILIRVSMITALSQRFYIIIKCTSKQSVYTEVLGL